MMSLLMSFSQRVVLERSYACTWHIIRHTRRTTRHKTSQNCGDPRKTVQKLQVSAQSYGVGKHKTTNHCISAGSLTKLQLERTHAELQASAQNYTDLHGHVCCNYSLLLLQFLPHYCTIIVG
jgi:hypothetical protein